MVGNLEQAEAVLRAAEIPFERCAHFFHGTQHVLYRVLASDRRQFILKIARVGLPLGDVFNPARLHLSGLRAEARAVELARNITTPKPIRLISTDPPAVLMPFVAGESGQRLWDTRRMDVAGLRSLCFAMGRGLAGVHSRKRPADPGEIPDLPGCDPSSARLLHMDYHLGNVQVVPDRRRGGFKVNGVVDWVLCRWGPREADMVEMAVSVFRQIPGTRDAFMGGYRSAGGLPLDRQVEYYWIRRELERRVADPEHPAEHRATWQKWLDEIQRYD